MCMVEEKLKNKIKLLKEKGRMERLTQKKGWVKINLKQNLKYLNLLESWFTSIERNGME